MSLLFSNNPYQIKRLEQNSNNVNKFIYLDCIDANIKTEDNNWVFNVNYYVINNSLIPYDLLQTNINLPFAEIKDITMFPNEQLEIPNWVSQKNDCKIYNTSFNLDVTNAKLSETNLINYLININFRFNINVDVLNVSLIQASQQDLNQFITEWETINEKLSFNYTNYMLIENDDGKINNSNIYYLNSRIGNSVDSKYIVYDFSNNFILLNTPINKILSLYHESPFWINKIVFRFHYSLETDEKIKLYEFTRNKKIYVYEHHDVLLDFGTHFNEENNSIEDSLSNNDGFYIPKNASGYLEVLISITYDDNTRTYNFSKPFSFVESDSYTYLNIKDVFINNLNGFERMIF